MAARLDPTYDVVFKLLFSRPSCKDLLISLLTAVLRPKQPITSATVLNPELKKNAGSTIGPGSTARSSIAATNTKISVLA
jgi:hypothetical protein